MSEPRILVWDIESTGLVADFGTLLCVGYRWLGEKKVHVPSIMDYPGWEKDPTNDKALTRDFLKVFETADMTVTYFGSVFDKKFFQAKCLEHNLGIPPNTPMVDLFFTVKSNLALSRKSLQNVGYYLNLSSEKTPVEGKLWRRASSGHVPSLKAIVKHCKADVEVLEEAYMRLRPLVRKHPRVKGRYLCAVCGSNHLQSRGPAMTILLGPRKRLQCQDCGAWSTVPAK